MSALTSLQKDFQRSVMHGGDDALAHIVGTDAAAADERLKVYYDAYRLRLLDILESDFAGLRSLVDAREFESLGLAYLDAHPSAHPSVRWFGEQLPAFLARAQPWAARPELAQMAELEWLRGRAFDAAEAPAVSVDELAAVPAEAWPAVCIRFHPSLRQLALDFNVAKIWQAVSREDAPPLEKYPATTPWLIWRQGLTVFWRSEHPAEDFAVSAFRSGADFTAVCAGLCDWYSEADVPGIAVGLLRQWTGEGLISAVTTTTE